MKNSNRFWIAALALLLHVAPIGAAPVGIDMKDATIPQFAELVFKSILRRDFVLGNGVGSSDAKVSVTIKAMEPESLVPFATSVLSGYGFAVDASGPVVFITRVADRALAPDLPAAASSFEDPEKPTRGSAQDSEAIDEEEKTRAYVPQFRNIESLQEAVKLTGVKVAVPKIGGALVITGKESRVVAALQLLRQLDRRNGAIDVRAMVIEYTDSSEDVQSFSAVASILGNRLGIQIGNGSTATSSISIKGASLNAVISAMSGDSRFKQLAEPRLRVLDGVRSRIQVGSNVPVRGQITTDKNGNPVASIEYKQAGIILELTPQVLETAILMNVHQQISSVSATTSSGIDSPTLNTREVDTVVDVSDGEIVMLGGLDSTTDVQSASGLSFLPTWMRGSAKTSARTQIFLLLEVNRVASSTDA